jgi:hypothetical protein
MQIESCKLCQRRVEVKSGRLCSRLNNPACVFHDRGELRIDVKGQEEINHERTAPENS